MTQKKKPFENIVGKGGNTGCTAFSPLPTNCGTMFSTLSETTHYFSNILLILSPANAPKNCGLVKS